MSLKLSPNNIINADDFGLNKDINTAILNLIDLKIINSVSILINSPFISNHEIAQLQQLKKNGTQIGLHLNLTESFNSSDYSVKKQSGFILKSSLKYLLNGHLKQLISAEFKNQIDQFNHIFGFLPNHIDSHHHVHQWPIINDCLITLVKTYQLNSILIRNTCINLKTLKIFLFKTSFKSLLKCIILSIAGFYFKRKAVNCKIKTNDLYSGCYSFKNFNDFSFQINLFRQDSSTNSKLSIFVVHPSIEANNNLDTIALSRLNEYNLLVRH